MSQSEKPRVVLRRRVKYRDNTYCCVPQCRSQNSLQLDVSFHRFPKEARDPFRRKQWIAALRMGKEVTDRMMVCSKHFRREDYVLPEVSTYRPSLEKFAVPSLFLPVSDPPQESSKSSGLSTGTKRNRKNASAENKAVEEPEKVVHIVKVRAVESSDKSGESKEENVEQFCECAANLVKKFKVQRSSKDPSKCNGDANLSKK